MSEFERASTLLAALPEYKLSYVIGYIQGLMADETVEIPNETTIAAMEEVEEMIRTGSGERWAGSTEDLFAMLDAEEDDEEGE